MDNRHSVLYKETVHLILSVYRQLCQPSRQMHVAGISRIYAIDEARIAETDSHEELIVEGGPYRELYERQFIAWEKQRQGKAPLTRGF